MKAKKPQSETEQGAAQQAAGHPSPRRRRRLHTLGGVRAFLARMIGQLEDDEIDQSKAKALVYAASTLAKVISDELRTTEIDERLRRIEAGMGLNPSSSSKGVEVGDSRSTHKAH